MAEFLQAIEEHPLASLGLAVFILLAMPRFHFKQLRYIGEKKDDHV